MSAVVTEHRDGTINIAVRVRDADTVRTGVYIYQTDNTLAFNLDLTVANPVIIETLIADLQEGLMQFTELRQGDKRDMDKREIGPH